MKLVVLVVVIAAISCAMAPCQGCGDLGTAGGGIDTKALVAALRAKGGQSNGIGLGIGLNGGIGIGIGGDNVNGQASGGVGIGTNGNNGVGLSQILGAIGSSRRSSVSSNSFGIDSSGILSNSGILDSLTALQNTFSGIGIGVGGSSQFGRAGNGIGIGQGNIGGPGSANGYDVLPGGNGLAVGGSSMYGNGGDGIGVSGQGVVVPPLYNGPIGAGGNSIAVGGYSKYGNGGQGSATGGSVKPSNLNGGVGSTDVLLGGNSKAVGGSSTYYNGGNADSVGGPVNIGSGTETNYNKPVTQVSRTYVPGQTTYRTSSDSAPVTSNNNLQSQCVGCAY